MSSLLRDNAKLLYIVPISVYVLPKRAQHILHLVTELPEIICERRWQRSLCFVLNLGFSLSSLVFVFDYVHGLTLEVVAKKDFKRVIGSYFIS